MKSKTTILTAIALLISSVPMSANIQTEFDETLLERCNEYRQLERSELQAELEDLLLRDPDDECISFIIALLGTPPIAQVPTNPPGGDGPDVY